MSRHRALILVAALWASACSAEPQALDWQIVFAPSVDPSAAVRVRARILSGGCAASTELYVADVPPSASIGPLPPVLGRGRYGFDAVAVDADCRAFATGCEEIDLPAEGVTSVSVLLESPRGVLCSAAECVMGICGGGDDGGLDSGPDAPDDATMDGGDASPDGGDASPDGGDASPDGGDGGDASPDAPRPSCDELFGAAQRYLPCAEMPDSCEFYSQPRGAMSCDEVCATAGETCVMVFDQGAGEDCIYAGATTCDARPNDFVCTCTRS